MKTLVLVDIQNDFCSGGALEVKGGDAVVGVANKLMRHDLFDLVVATQDWHPPYHESFASNQDTSPFTLGELNGIPQVWWPDHCIWGSHGAEFHPILNMNKVAAIIRKGMNADVDSYSGFLENDKETDTGLGALLDMDDNEIYVMGLATDYCVKFTALDSLLEFGFNTYLIKDGCRAVNMQQGDSEKAIQEMSDAGVIIVNSEDIY